jgi:hypothetical protein
MAPPCYRCRDYIGPVGDEVGLIGGCVAASVPTNGRKQWRETDLEGLAYDEDAERLAWLNEQLSVCDLIG